ncbi:MAG TPA: hypothetical protein PK954_02070 [Anaerolineales bacterium]|nr:hypothetical protein [Anaerolineales bacterium]
MFIDQNALVDLDPGATNPLDLRADADPGADEALAKVITADASATLPAAVE